VPLQVGTNNLIVSAHDAAGNTSAVTLTVSYSVPDTTPPTIAIASPATSPSYTVANAAALSGTASDAGGVSGVSWTSSSGASGVASGTTAWTASVPLQLGTNTITIAARDNAGNTASTNTMVVYLLPPTLIAPGGTVTTPTPVFTWNASPVVTTYVLRVNDASQAGKISLTLTPTQAGCPSGGVCTAAPGVALASGSASWSVETIVGTGGVTSAPMTFTVPIDTTPPAVTISVPTTKSSFNTSATVVTVSGSALDTNTISAVTWSTDQGASGVATGNSTWWSADIPIAPGANVVTIYARDAFGNVGTAMLTIRRNRAKK
jgi:hypothetical protein